MCSGFSWGLQQVAQCDHRTLTPINPAPVQTHASGRWPTLEKTDPWSRILLDDIHNTNVVSDHIPCAAPWWNSHVLVPIHTHGFLVHQQVTVHSCACWSSVSSHVQAHRHRHTRTNKNMHTDTQVKTHRRRNRQPNKHEFLVSTDMHAPHSCTACGNTNLEAKFVC